MNPVAIALRRGIERASTHAELATAFDEEWNRIEFAKDAQSVVLNVDSDTAREWFQNDLPDVDLCLAVRDTPQAIWWASLPRLGQYRKGLESVRELYDKGARLIIFQTRNPILIQHARRLRFGADQLGDGYTRIFGNEVSLTRWLGKRSGTSC